MGIDLKIKTDKATGAISNLVSANGICDIAICTLFLTIGNALGDGLRSLMRPGVSPDYAFMSVSERMTDNASKATALVAIVEYLR